jgi:hypothetical protein
MFRGVTGFVLAAIGGAIALAAPMPSMAEAPKPPTVQFTALHVFVVGGAANPESIATRVERIFYGGHVIRVDAVPKRSGGRYSIIYDRARKTKTELVITPQGEKTYWVEPFDGDPLAWVQARDVTFTPAPSLVADEVRYTITGRHSAGRLESGSIVLSRENIPLEMFLLSESRSAAGETIRLMSRHTLTDIRVPPIDPLEFAIPADARRVGDK